MIATRKDPGLDPGSLLRERYRILKPLGQGGQGAVFLCEDLAVYKQKRALKQLINLKKLPPEERTTALALFEREGAFLSSLNHPGLPRISDKFTHAGRCYLTIDFVEGRNLEEILCQQPDFFTEERVLLIALQLCDILQYMHSRKPPVVFRDLKPENIILTGDGQVKLIDFGIARLYDKKKKTDTIQVGTVGYAAPEQYSGSTDPRSDIYAFGALLHHLLTGLDPKKMAPFEAEGIPIRSLNPRLSREMEAVVCKALTGKRSRRYRSVVEMRSALLANNNITVCGGCGTLLTRGEERCHKCLRKNPACRTKEKLEKHWFLQPSETNKPGLLLEGGAIHIGRLPANEMVIADEGISGRHALIEMRGSRLFIHDLSSTNGTWVNGRRVTHKRLKEGARIRLGKTELVLAKV